MTVEDVGFVTADVTANDTDVEDVTVAGSSAVLVDAALKGTAVSNGDGTFTYTPDPATDGTDSFTYRVTDSHGGESPAATVTVFVTPGNDPPAAMDDALSVDSKGFCHNRRRSIERQ